MEETPERVGAALRNPYAHPAYSRLTAELSRLRSEDDDEWIGSTTDGMLVGSIISPKTRVKALLRDFFEPVSAFVPAEVVRRWMQVGSRMIRDGNDTWIELRHLRKVFDEAVSARNLLHAYGRRLRLLLGGNLHDPVWLKRCWDERLDLCNVAGRALDLETTFNEMQQERFKISGSNALVEALGEDVLRVSLKDLVLQAFRNCLKLNLPNDLTQVHLARLMALIRAGSAEERAAQLNKQLTQWRGNMQDGLGDEGRIEPFSQHALTHFLPVWHPSQLHVALALLAAHAARMAPDGVQRFIACCRAQASLAQRLNRVVPPRWLVGVLRVHHQCAEILRQQEKAAPLTWVSVLSHIRTQPPGAFLVHLGHHSLMFCRREVRSREEDRLPDYLTLGIYDPDRGYVECDIGDSNQSRLMKEQERSMARRPEFLGLDHPCHVQRVQISKEIVDELGLDLLVDWKED